MREWVQLPSSDKPAWQEFARLACQYVGTAAQITKDRLIGALTHARSGVMDTIRALPPGRLDEVFLGEWSAMDLLAHLIGWDHTNSKAVEVILAGKKPGFWAYHDRDWKTYNARLVAQYRRDGFEELVAAAEGSHRKLIDFLRTVPADEYVNRKQIGSLLRVEAEDEEEHRRQVEAFAGKR